MAKLANPLEFEKPLVDLEEQLERLKNEIDGGDPTRRDEYARLEAKTAKLRQDIYGKLTSYQRVQLSRHFDRPFTLDYLNSFVEDFTEFHGDRAFRDDPAIVGGTGKIADVRVMVIGQQRGDSVQERVRRNFGMAQPEGYRKALRLFKMAERFNMPVITFIDTQGAYPGLEAEERGQAEAIARNLFVLARLRVPVVCVVIGEGGSGGALALGVGDRILMLENACYSVITPEGCASILWHADKEGAAEQAKQAAEMLRITAKDLKELGVIDDVVPEPVGGAHSNHEEAADTLKVYLLKHLHELMKLDKDELVEQRYRKFRQLGPVTGDTEH